MAGPGGAEVGRVSIRVVPDTSKFRSQLYAELRGLRNKATVKVRVVPDVKKFKLPKKLPNAKPVTVPLTADVDSFQKKALADLKKLAGKLDANVPLTADGERFRTESQRLLRDAQSRITATIPVDPQLAAAARRRIQSDLDQLSRRVRPQLTMDIAADTRRARQQVRQLVQDVPRLSEQGVGSIRINIDDDHTKAELRALIAELKAEAALAGVEIDVDIDVPAMKAAGLAAARAGAGLGSFGDAAAVTGAVVAFIAPVLALVSGLLTTLPGLIAGVLTPVAALTLGFEGLKRAAERLREPFNKLRDTMAGAFERAFTPLADQLGSSGLFTMLEERLPLIANGLASMAAGFVDSITSAAGMDKISNIIGNIGAATFQARPGVKSFSDALLGLAEGFTAKFPGLANTFNSWGTSFSAWVDRVTADGSLDRALETLGKIGGQLGGLLVDMGKAGFEWLSDPEFGNKMTKFVEDVRYLVNVLLPAMKGIFEEIADSVSGITDGIRAIQGLLPGIQLPNDERKGRSPGIAGWLEGGIESALENLKAKVVAVMPTLMPIISQLWTGLVASATTALTTIATTIATLPATIGNAFTVVRDTIVGVFTGIAGAVAQALASIPGLVAGIFGQLPAIASGAIGGIVGAVATGFAQVVATITTAMGQALTAVTTGVANIVAEAASIGGKVAAAVGNLGGVLVGAGRALMDGLLQGITAGLRTVLDFASGIAAKIAAVKGPLPKDRTTLIPAGEALMEGLGTGLDNGLAPILAQVRQIAGAVFDALFDSMQGRRAVDVNVTPALAGLDDMTGSMKSLAATSGEFRTNMAQAVPTSIPADISAALQQLRQEKDLLDLRSKELAVAKDQAPDKMARAALQAQLDQINARKREIALQQEQIDYQRKYGQEMSSTQEDYSSHIEGLARLPYNFAKAGGDQFLSDIGVGGGALSGLANQAMEYGSQFIFNVSSIGEALTAQQTQQNKMALAATGR